MKTLLLITSALFCLVSINANAASINLEPGEVYGLGSELQITCKKAPVKKACEDAQSTCLEKGFYPNACAKFSSCNMGQTECLKKGFYPNTCLKMKNSKAQVKCLKKGFYPNSCQEF